jgi:hypothetical protein
MMEKGQQRSYCEENVTTMASTSDPVLPVELLRPIIQHLADDRQTLCAISVTCRMLQQEGQRGLYKKMTHSIKVDTHFKFLGTILQNNRLALLVEEYSQDTVAHYQRGILWDYLCRGLRAMVNLKILKFRAVGGHPASEILTGCTFQLKGLFWGSRSDEDGLSDFIPYQRFLEGLNVEWHEEKHHLIPPTSCPRLKVLVGNRGALETFLANRRPISVAWIPQLEDSLNRPVHHLASELGRLRFFTFGGYCSRPSFNSIYTYLHSVEVLELVGIHNEVRNYCLSPAREYFQADLVYLHRS